MQFDHETAFSVLLLQAADEGRGPLLFGDSLQRARSLIPSFLIGEKFPEMYFEFPLKGEPFLDITLLYSELSENEYVDSPLVSGCNDVMDFYRSIRADNDRITCGFELDCSAQEIPSAAIHFQPRDFTELVIPFCQALGEADRGKLYLAQNERMPLGWELSYFGLFRGRPQSPLRVCGYVSVEEKLACAEDPAHLATVFAQAGFEAFDDELLSQASRLLAVAPQEVDFQLDVYPDGSVGDIFAFDVSFVRKPDSKICASFMDGENAVLMSLLQEWGIVDDRIRCLPEMAFTRGLPQFQDDGSISKYGLSLIPGWMKVRWNKGVLQPAKMYMQVGAGPIIKKEDKDADN